MRFSSTPLPSSITLLCAAMPALAQEEAAPAPAPTPESVWEGSVGLGFLQTTGNVESQSLNGNASVTNERVKWRHEALLETLVSSEQDETTGERYLASGKTDYKFSERRYAFGYLKYERDRFSGYEYQATASLGYGERVIHTDGHTLDLEGGPGFRRNKISESADENPGLTDDEAILRGALDYLWKISDTSRFGESVSVEAGDEATISKSVTSLTTQVAGALATKITYTVRHATDVPEGFDKTNTETSVALVYEF